MILLKLSPGNLLIIPCQLAKFQAPRSNISLDIFLTRFHSDFFQRGLTPEGEITRTRKNTDQLFSMRNPYMKFQNHSMHGSKIMYASDFILIFSRSIISEREVIRTRKKKRQLFCHEEFLTNGWTDGRTDARTHNPKPICPVNFFDVGGIIMLT